MRRLTGRWPGFPPRLPRTERSEILSVLSAQQNTTVAQLQNLSRNLRMASRSVSVAFKIGQALKHEAVG